jgi:L-ascorbate metabolism protein UlaG (beta-lactamase superfamily)
MAGVGGLHAVIHREIPRIGNTGIVLTAEGSPTVFHPGDMIDTAPDGIDLLAVPLAAPWCAFKETAEFVRSVAPAIAVPIHDAIVSPAGRAIYLRQTAALAPAGTIVRDLAGAGPTDF